MVFVFSIRITWSTYLQVNSLKQHYVSYNRG